MAAYHFIQGHTYMAGADVPFFVSLDDVREGAEEEGFTFVLTVDREESGDPPIILPPAAMKKEWDLWGTGLWNNASATLDLPDEVAWVADLTPSTPPGPAPPGLPVTGSDTPVVTVVPSTRASVGLYIVGAVVTGATVAVISHILSRGKR